MTHLKKKKKQLSTADEPCQDFCTVLYTAATTFESKTFKHLPVVGTERCVWGIAFGTFPTHVVPLQLFNCLQCLPLTGKCLHPTAWRTGLRQGLGGDWTLSNEGLEKRE